MKNTRSAHSVQRLVPLLLVFLLAAARQAPADTTASPATTAAVDAIKAAFQQNDVDRAVSIGEKAVTASPNDAKLQLWLGRAYGRKAQASSIFSQMGLAKKCRTAFEKAVSLDPASVEARLDLMSYHLQAPGIAGGDKEVAKKQADAILKLDPVRGHLAWGQIWDEAKESAKAEAEYRKAVDGAPRELRARIALSSLLVVAKRPQEARELWREFMKAEPDQSYAHYALARISVATGEDLAEGVEHMKAYLAVPPKADTPTWADAHWRLSNLYEKMGRKDDAKAELREALKLNPEHAAAKKDLKRLEG